MNGRTTGTRGADEASFFMDLPRFAPAGTSTRRHGQERIRPVRLYGALGREFGRIHRLAVASPAEAIRALCVLLPDFETRLQQSDESGIAYACFVGRKNIVDDEIMYPVGADDIRIAPLLAGSKRAGAFNLMIGQKLLKVVAPISLAMGDFEGAQLALGLSGAAFSASRIDQWMMPTPESFGARKSVDNGASYNFNGPVNTTNQGSAVPLLYGELITGSAVISAGLYAEDQV